jgi:hypothetical protein
MHKLVIKLFAEKDSFGPTEFIPIFHRWIQTHAIADHLLIDVADYAHVPAGPGTLLVASEANIHMDRGANRLGLMYVRKLPIAGATTFAQTLRGVFGYALSIADLMEKEPALDGRLKLRRDEIAIRFNDRLNTPNTTLEFEKIKSAVQAVATELFGKGTTVERGPTTPGQLLEVIVRAPV